MNHLWTPWRATYIKDKKQGTGCVFCNAAALANEPSQVAEKDRSHLVVYRASLTFVLLNRYPYTNGHLMIAPYLHVSRLNEAPADVSLEMMQLVRSAEAILQETYRPGGINLGMNLGEAAGAGIEQHIHMHVLPRWSGDANFMTSVGETRIIPEALEETYEKLLSGFRAL